VINRIHNQLVIIIKCYSALSTSMKTDHCNIYDYEDDSALELRKQMNLKTFAKSRRGQKVSDAGVRNLDRIAD